MDERNLPDGAKKTEGRTGKRLNDFSFALTPVGCVVLIVFSIILIRSLVNRNSYEIVISCVILLLLLVLGIIGIWKSRKLNASGFEPGWKPPFPMTADSGVDETRITGLDVSVPAFFRLHFFISGRFFPEGCGFAAGLQENGKSSRKKNGCLMSVETSVPRGDTEAKIALDFPMSGIFFGDGRCRLNDIFGFYSFPCGYQKLKTVKIRCAPCFGKKIIINTQSGAEDRRNKPASNEERYHMREYTPGDRFRDINWKSSEKIDTLITRISTETQEKTSRIEVHFRNYGLGVSKPGVKRQKLGDSFSLEALWLLDRAKARLSYFLRSIRDQNASFIFDVHTAQGDWEIFDENDLDAFLEELAGLSFFPPRNENAASSGANFTNTGDLYIFSTACDTELPGFLIANSQRPVTLFLVQPGNIEGAQEPEILHARDFALKGCALPAHSRAKMKPLMVQSSKAEMFYAEIKL
ncbi:MAG: DUF58 domain-containing protein [Treponema sp.]|nr:DUF58 domain-containing protein [Treponema sp.]